MVSRCDHARRRGRGTVVRGAGCPAARAAASCRRHAAVAREDGARALLVLLVAGNYVFIT